MSYKNFQSQLVTRKVNVYKVGGTKTLSRGNGGTSTKNGLLNVRSKMLRVSRKFIRKKAIIVYGDLKRIDPDGYDEKFEATNGWLFKFMKRHNLSLRRKTSVAQKDPDILIAKIVSYILRVRRSRMKYSYQQADIIAFDETPYLGRYGFR